MLDQIQQLLPLESSERSVFLLYLGNFCCLCISHTKTAGFEPGSSPGFKLLWIKLQGLMWFRESKAWNNSWPLFSVVDCEWAAPGWIFHHQAGPVGLGADVRLPIPEIRVRPISWRRNSAVPVVPLGSPSIPFPDNSLPRFFLPGY